MPSGAERALAPVYYNLDQRICSNQQIFQTSSELLWTAGGSGVEYGCSDLIAAVLSSAAQVWLRYGASLRI